MGSSGPGNDSGRATTRISGPETGRQDSQEIEIVSK